MNSIKAEALLKELNDSLKAETDKPNGFPWVPVSLGIGAIGILAVAALIIKKRKQRSR